MMVDDLITSSFLFLKMDKLVIQLINHQMLVVNKNLHIMQKNFAFCNACDWPTVWTALKPHRI